jgi:hypothetical protein
MVDMKKIGKDKWMHIGVSFVLMIFIGAYDIGLGFAATMGIGIAKEIYDDKSKKGTCDIYDVLADYVGMLLAYGLILISNSL